MINKQHIMCTLPYNTSCIKSIIRHISLQHRHQRCFLLYHSGSIISKHYVFGFKQQILQNKIQKYNKCQC